MLRITFATGLLAAGLAAALPAAAAGWATLSGAAPLVIGLQFIDGCADGLGVNTSLMIPLVGGRLGTPTTLVADAHSLGLVVHGWTFRAENIFLPNEFDSSTDPAAFGDLKGQIQAFVALGMDGFFTDQPDLGVAAVVPEPGTWALMLGGLGLLGAAARRRPAH